MKKALALALSIALLGGSLAVKNTAPAITASAVTSAVQAETSAPEKTGIYAFSNKDKSISIRWKKAENAEGYNIYRYSYNSKKWSKVGDVKSTETLKFTDTGLTSGSAYTYKVKPYKIVDSKKVENNDCKKFSAVTKPRAVKVTGKVYGNSLKLKWSKANCSGYRIYSYRNGKWKLSARVSKNKTSFTYKNLSNKNYSFRVVPVKKTSKGKVYKSTGNSTLKVNMVKKTSYTAQIMYANKDTDIECINTSNNSWGWSGITIDKGDKVIAYETITLPGSNIKARRIKYGNTGGYVWANDLSLKAIKKLTQKDMNKLVKEMQEYANNVVKENVIKDIEKLKDKLPDGYDWNAYLREHNDITPETASWLPPDDVYTTYTYAEAKKTIKECIDHNYDILGKENNVVIYARWCPNGKGNTNYAETRDCWEIYCLR